MRERWLCLSGGDVSGSRCSAGTVAVDQSARVLSLENAWNQAEVTHDAQALSTLLAETFDFSDDDGRFMNKSQWLAHIGNGVDHYDQLSSSGMAVYLECCRCHRDVAIQDN